MTKTEIQQVLQERGLRPLKQLGQNFLFDQNLCAWLVQQAVGNTPGDTPVIEIGPGLGALTTGLLERGLRVLALEKDRGLADWLRQRFARPLATGQFRLVEGDALETMNTLEGDFPLVLGNLPYNISTPLLLQWIQRSRPPHRLFFLLQKEMAQRLAATPRTKEYGAVSVQVQADYKVTLVRTVPASVFYPAPEVASAAVELVRRDDALTEAQRQSLHDLVRGGFSQRRKKLSNLLEIDESRRAEELTVAEWRNLVSPP
jgi:16S rRNA (adenine1518-N6/adenine1519-N6)-dimethyltransferase